MMVLVGFSSILKNEKQKVDTTVKKQDVIPITFINNSNVNETKFLNHLDKLIDNKSTNADHMINKFSKNENLNDLYDK